MIRIFSYGDVQDDCSSDDNSTYNALKFSKSSYPCIPLRKKIP